MCPVSVDILKRPVVQGQSVSFRFQNFSVSKRFHFLDVFGFGIKKFGIDQSIGFGVEKSFRFGFIKIWYRKKYQIHHRKKFVLEKVSDSVLFRFWVSSHTAQGKASEETFFIQSVPFHQITSWDQHTKFTWFSL